MVVTIPLIPNVPDEPIKVVTVEIADHCPLCGAKRGVRMWEGTSYDGVTRVSVWTNACTHVDRYRDVLAEARRLPAQIIN